MEIDIVQCLKDVLYSTIAVVFINMQVKPNLTRATVTTNTIVTGLIASAIVCQTFIDVYRK